MTEREFPWFVYIIETDKGHLYTGITTDVERRWQEHLAVANGSGKKGARFFNSQKPVRLCYQEICDSRSSASRREAAIKKMTAAQKRALIETSQS